MALDGLFLHQITKQIKKELPAKINKIQQLSDFEFIFYLYSNQGSQKLLISLHSTYNRIQFTEKQYEAIDSPSSFTMLLRKLIQSGIIKSIEQMGLDRVLKMKIEARNDLGDMHLYDMYIELMGKYANIILVGDDNRIIDALKRIPPFENSRRTVHPGAKFIPATPHIKKDPFVVIDNNFEGDDFTKEFHGFSPLLTKEMNYRLEHGETFQNVMEQLNSSDTMYISYVNDKEYFHAIPLTHFEVETHPYPLQEGMDVEYYDIEEKERIRLKTGNIFKVIRQEKAKSEKKLPKLLQSLDDAYACDIYREYGDLLFANLHTIEKKPIVELQSFERDEIVKIPIDMKYDLKANANKYYNKYHKQKRAQEILKEQIAQCEEEISYLQMIELQLSQATLKDADEIVEELTQKRYLRNRIANTNNHKKKKKKQEPNYDIYEFEDATIYVGKNNLQNDTITFKLANKEDTWFHAQGFHGSHVLVKSEHLTETIIRNASLLASYYSQARSSSSVPVDYCRVKDIKRIPASKIGLVSIKNQKTIYIDPQPNLIHDLEAYRVEKKKN